MVERELETPTTVAGVVQFQQGVEQRNKIKQRGTGKTQADREPDREG